MSLHLEHIQTFHAVAQTGSLSSAAKQLGLSHPTVRRHIECLEDSLAVSLFTRAPNGMTLTAAAENLLPLADSMIAQAKAFARAAASTNGESGTVRITATEFVGSHLLPEILAKLRHKAPEILIELMATEDFENLSSRAADIAIRMGQPPHQASLVVKKLPFARVSMFCAPWFDIPQTSEELTAAPFISDDERRVIEQAMESLGVPAPENIVLRTDNFNVQAAAIAAGVGIGPMMVAAAKRLGLTPISPDFAALIPCFAVMHEDQRNVPAIRVVFDHLVDELEAVLGDDTP